jgi:hypothetical protein
MYLAVKYARKKRKERQAAKLAGPSAQDPSSAEARVQVQPGVEQPSEQHVDPMVVEAAEAEKPAATADSPTAPAEPKMEVAVLEPAVTSGKAEPAATSGEAETAVVSDEEKIQKRKRRQYRIKIIFGLVAPFALQALDTTIIASALPYIAKDFSTTTMPLSMSS